MAIDRNAVIKEAQKFAVKGQFDKAIAEWKKLIREFPNDANAFNTIGDLCLKKDAKADAVEAYRKAADILASDGFTSKAIALYKKVLNIDPKKIEVHLALGDLNAEKGLTGNALESYKLVADHYTRNRDTIRTLGIYQKMADLNPSNITFRLRLGDMYTKEGMQSEAIATYLEAADGYMSKNAFKEARQAFEKVLALDPDNKKAYYKAGIIYFREEKFVEACKALKPAFENDPSNQELIDIYLDALTKAGRNDDIEDAYKKLISRDAGRIDLRERLYRHYLLQKNYAKALAEVSDMANVLAENKEFDTAEAVLKGFLAEVPRSAEGHCRLAEYYNKMAKGNDAATELVQAADILLEEGDKEGAKDVLTRAIDMAPDMERAQQRLESLQAPPAAPEPAGSETSEPTTCAQSVPVSEETSPVVSEEQSDEPVISPVPDEDPAIVEALREIEVLLKYGLGAKAVEQLEGMVGRFPVSRQLRIKLKELYAEQGNMRKAAEHLLALADICVQQGIQDDVEPLLQSALKMDPGNTEIASRLGVTPVVPAETPALSEHESTLEPVPGPFSTGESSAEEIARPEDHPAEMTFSDLEMAPFEAEAEPPIVPASLDNLVFEEPGSIGNALDGHSETGQASSAPDMPAEENAASIDSAAISGPETAQLEPATKAGSEPPDEGEQSSLLAQPESPVREPLPIETDISEIWAEAEFYYQQGLFDEAKKYYAKIVERTPSDRRAIERLSDISREEEETQEFSKLAEAVEGLEDLNSGGESRGNTALTASDEEAVRSLMSEIRKLRQVQKTAPEPSGKQVSAPVPIEGPLQRQSSTRDERADIQKETTRHAGEGDFFDLSEELREDRKTVSPPVQKEKSEDFFDLASELREELSSIAVPQEATAPEGEQSLDDIFEEFKKGVKQQEIKEDADTHYNLGVAYKEMGLLDDALGEFVLTAKDEPKFIQSRYMLGLCYMGKGEYGNAIVEIQNAINSSELAGGNMQDRIEMHYDLGLAYQGAGNRDGALAQFQKVHDTNPGFRDATAKLKEIKKGSLISPERLKDDIDKEISAKFLEEGERIKREEKTKKNEKVRS